MRVRVLFLFLRREATAQVHGISKATFYELRNATASISIHAVRASAYLRPAQFVPTTPPSIVISIQTIHGQLCKATLFDSSSQAAELDSVPSEWVMDLPVFTITLPHIVRLDRHTKGLLNCIVYPAALWMP